MSRLRILTWSADELVLPRQCNVEAMKKPVKKPLGLFAVKMTSLPDGTNHVQQTVLDLTAGGFGENGEPMYRKGEIEMRKYFVLVGLLLLAAGSTVAQEYPTVETSPAFMFIRTPIGGQSFNCAGGGGTIAYNLTSALGIAADLGGCKFFGNTLGLGNTLSGNQFTFLFGPRFTIRNASPLQPFFEFNLGGDRIALTCHSGALNCLNRTLGATVSKTAFAMTVGGGVDIKLTKKFAIRAAQLEYLYTRFGNDCPFAVCNSNNNQNSFRLKSGVVMSWGASSD